MQAVDALNIMYVATTRAEKGMTVIAAMPSENTGKNAAIPFSNLSQLLHKYIETLLPCVLCAVLMKVLHQRMKDIL